ncbi:MAG: DUF4124 domain-containing protein [Deltaproteobacteria bacterium]|nr:DUF4124 domain-containing protein [Deltaproteobacteria bacterium]MBW2416064.1 DUF4124 domain-containing protein [Deltaproteobacteria bacterium]
MSHHRRRSAVLGAGSVALCVALLAAPVTALCGVYKWVDQNGVAHYTIDREAIPRHLRARLTPAEGRTAVPPKAAPLPLPEGIDPDVLEGVPPQNVRAALDLEEKIERDREAIKDMISRQGQTGADLANDPKLREIAERLPRLQSESAELKTGD